VEFVGGNCVLTLYLDLCYDCVVEGGCGDG
jgi:hypothetical protein